MTRIIASLFTASLLAVELTAAPAHAQNRVFVAAQGLDANPCTFALPCRTFQRAHNVVAAGGEIDVLDPAGYGAVTITKSISIQGHGFSGISAPAGDAITIGAGANDRISLRGLLIDGVGTGFRGIRFNTGASLNMQDCLIRNFQNHGIDYGGPASVKTSLYITNTQIFEMGGKGINIAPTGGSEDIIGVLNHVEVNKPLDDGLTLFMSLPFTGSISFEIRDSVFTNAGLSGISIFSALARISRTTLAYNTTGFFVVNGGTLASYGDNNVADNGNYVGALAPYAHQ